MLNIFKRKAISNSLWMISEKVFKLILGLFVSAIVARHLSPEGFGKLNYLLALLTILVNISALGLNRIIVRNIVNTVQDTHNELVVISTFLRLMAGSALFIISTIIFYSYYPNDWYLYSLIFLSLFFTPLDVIELYHQGLGDIKLISLSRFISMVLSNTFKIYLVFTNKPLEWFYSAVLFEYVITSILFYFIYKYKHKENIFELKKIKSKKISVLLRESWPEVIAGLGAILFMRLDVIMLEHMLGSKSAGIYSAAIRISEAWLFIPIAIVAATFPYIIKGKNLSQNHYLLRLKALFSCLIIISVLAAITVTFSSNWIITLIFGVDYIESSHVLIIHCWVGVFICLGISSGSALAAEKKLVWNLYRNVFGLAVNVLLNLYLIDSYGANGAAYATLISIFCAFWVFDILFKPLRYMFFLKLRAFNILSLKKIYLLENKK